MPAESADERDQQEVGLVGEVVVEHALGDVRCRSEVADRDRRDLPLGEELLGNGDQVLAQDEPGIALPVREHPSASRHGA